MSEPSGPAAPETPATPAPASLPATPATPAALGTSRVGRIMVVCTGNVCRSPYIERRLAQLLADTDVLIESAGTRALVGQDMQEGSHEALESVGADASGFISRQLTHAMLDDADLVITATQRHRRDVVSLNPRTLRRTFSLGELADLLRTAELAPDGDEPWATTVAEAARQQRGQSPALPAGESDITDPYGRGAEAYALMTREVETYLLVVASALRPPAR
ncbi:arsenate reductase/protein-tyrosine-phosphatase family protein [Monashia sp. NPDC004114]